MNDGFQRGTAASTIFYHPQTHVRVVVRGNDCAFEATESELRKMRSRMCEWYDVKVRGILGTGKRDVRKIEILGNKCEVCSKWLQERIDDHNMQSDYKYKSGLKVRIQ